MMPKGKGKYKYNTIGGEKDGVARGSVAKEAKVNEQSKREAAGKARAATKARIAKTGTLSNQKLYAPPRDNFYRRWINDEGNRVARMENNGYSFVELSPEDMRLTSASNADGRVSQLVGTKQDGSALHAYLMEIPQEFHNQDRQENLDKIAAKEKGLLNGNMQDPDSKIWSGEVQFN